MVGACIRLYIYIYHALVTDRHVRFRYIQENKIKMLLKYTKFVDN